MAFYFNLHKVDKTFITEHEKGTADALLRMKGAFGFNHINAS